MISNGFVRGACFLVLAGQSLQAQHHANLAVRVEPETFVAGLPKSFTFVLTNASDHSIKLPNPSLRCRNLSHGSIGISLQFVPSRGVTPTTSQTVCIEHAVETGDGIVKDAAYWRTLQPGESLRLERNRWATSSEESPGTYRFTAYYLPPTINSADQERLIKAGVDFPRGPFENTLFVFVRRHRP